MASPVVPIEAPPVDWKNPDYGPIFIHRLKVLKWLRGDPRRFDQFDWVYRQLPNGPIQFLIDWGCTYDPRNVEIGLPALMPFIPFPKQIEWLQWVIELWQTRRNGATEKSRDCGVSWLAVGLGVTMARTFKGFSAGYGSRKQEYVDELANPKSLFWKARKFIELLPPEFRGGHIPGKHDPLKRLWFPHTDATLTGEAGDGIGRGDRQSMYFVDEAAHLERPQLAEQSLSATTNCRIDVSSVNGSANPFAQKIAGGKIPKFTFHWRDDPRKDEEWYAKQCDQLDPVTVAQEIDINYQASVEGQVIPALWANAAVDAHVKLGIVPTGMRRAALDVADEGVDKNCFTVMHGILIEACEEWSGKGSDTFHTAERAFGLADQFKLDEFLYDADGIGAYLRGDARVINEARRRPIEVFPFRGSGAIVNPTWEDVPGRLNEDFFENYKAQCYWGLRRRFQVTYRAVVEGRPFEPDEIISIPSGMPWTAALIIELGQPVYLLNKSGKILIDKKPNGARSPNKADSLMMAAGRPQDGVLRIDPDALEMLSHV